MTERKPIRRRTKRRLKAKLRRISRQMFITVITVVFTVLFAGYIAVLIVLKGPSPTFSDMMVSTMWESRRGKAVIRLLFSQEEIQTILSKNQVHSFDAKVDAKDNTSFDIPENEKDELEVVDVQGATFKGKMMIIRDPSRIQLGVNVEMPDPSSSYSVADYVAAANAIGGINGGGFDDPGGRGDGSIPQGIVIKDGKLVAGTLDTFGTVGGFNAENHLICGDMSGQQALDWGLQNAVTFGPVLLYDGHALPINGNGGGINPRSVIAQTSDGTVLLLAIDGRQPNSLGATFADCQNLLLQYGAVAAFNLDGGSSTVMVYKGEIINSVVSMNGDRSVPTAWLVK
ncbi:MAG: phosphodiester glycosidase family protein [Bulleidia sp.]